MRKNADAPALDRGDQEHDDDTNLTTPQNTEIADIRQAQIAALERRFHLSRRLAEIVAPFVYGGRK